MRNKKFLDKLQNDLGGLAKMAAARDPDDPVWRMFMNKQVTELRDYLAAEGCQSNAVYGVADLDRRAVSVLLPIHAMGLLRRLQKGIAEDELEEALGLTVKILDKMLTVL